MTFQLGKFQVHNDSHLIILRDDSDIPRKQLQKIRSILRKANKKWNGVLLHLKTKQELQSLSPQLIEHLYENLMAKFDPDLHATRMRRKEEAQKDVQKKYDDTAAGTVDRLAAAQKAGESERLKPQLDAVHRLEKAAQ